MFHPLVSVGFTLVFRYQLVITLGPVLETEGQTFYPLIVEDRS